MNLIADYTNLFYPKKAGKVSPVFKDVSGVGMIGSGAVVSGWNALSTTGKVAVGAGVGGLAVGTYDWLFGGKKAAPVDQRQAQNQSMPFIINPVVVQPNNPVYNQGDYSTNIISNSPYASQKKGMGMQAPFSPSQDTPFSVVPSQAATAAQTAAQGTDWATLAAIAGVALVAYGYTSRKEK